ncbi:sensor histidine kinase [Blastopirellula marina]|uniref:histidine kinase n=1 Tax=Blastopirellula marina DSM 3645 TaxID=314230 RepID=A3ZXP7_9BACT|nr:HAMP domain-containing sensor histidine kinase [Blastopirellula marina]EAQ78604.1 probable nitrogen regulation protein ntrB [Blastopirellula marina DSM 3645]
MRWPLRIQLLLPFAAVLLAIMIGVTLVTAQISVANAKARIETRLRDVATVLQSATFPLSEAVLEQMKGLSGAQYAVTIDGRLLRSTLSGLRSDQLTSLQVTDSIEHLALTEEMAIDDQQYFHAAVALQGRAQQGQVLHMFYPVDSYRKAWTAAAGPPFWIGLAGFLVLGIVAFALARNVTAPIAQLRKQVERIAAGDASPIPARVTNDEVRDLVDAVNQLAEQLTAYDEKIRTLERTRVLGQLGAGFAHQVRNAATGCRLALDIHALQCPQAHDESMAIANQQLALISTHLRAIVNFGKEERRDFEPLDLRQIVLETLPLVRPLAQHHHVNMTFIGDGVFPMMGEATLLQTVIVNLLTNAVEAIAGHPRDDQSADGEVRVELNREPGGVRLTVADNGPGLPPEIETVAFDPLITSKHEGVGLGLTIVREVARVHHGEATYRREDGETRFEIHLTDTRND